MKCIQQNETCFDVFRDNISKMTDKELIQQGFRLCLRTDADGREFLRIVEREEDKRGIY